MNEARDSYVQCVTTKQLVCHRLTEEKEERTTGAKQKSRRTVTRSKNKDTRFVPWHKMAATTLRSTDDVTKERRLRRPPDASASLRTNDRETNLEPAFDYHCYDATDRRGGLVSPRDCRRGWDVESLTRLLRRPPRGMLFLLRRSLCSLVG